MTRPKRTAEELRIAILDKICDVGEGVNKTAIANAVRIKRDGQKNFEITNAGRGNDRRNGKGSGWIVRI